MGRRARSKPTLRYTSPSVGSSWVRRVARPPPATATSSTSIGMDFVDAVKSDVDRVGSLARSAGSSRAACAARSARVSSSSALSSPALSRSRTALSSCSSAACSQPPSCGSGTRESVQRWRFSSTDSRRSSTKTAPPLRATSSLSEASASSKRRGSIGSRPYTHSERAPIMKERPFIGEADAARSRNSIVFIDASTADCSKPLSAIESSVSRMRADTRPFASSPGATPLRPTEKAACCSDAPYPPPTTAEPSLEASSGCCSAALGLPRSKSLSTPQASFLDGSSGLGGKSHPRVTNCVGAAAAAASTGYGSDTSYGSGSAGCHGICSSPPPREEPNSASHDSSSARRSAVGSSASSPYT
mmetsp:Transcript_19402/g.57492  ORF Transcript_19402/g.57492 Transcript_19402/m.57492 type:complete len:359 (+) Transcript_19402:1353-2429(+)